MKKFLLGLLVVLIVSTPVFAADYAADQKVDGLADVSGALVSGTKVVIQDSADTDKLGVATAQQVVNKGLEAPSAIGGTTPAAGTFTTITGGGGGFTVDADGDTVVKSLTMSGNSTGPQIIYMAEDTDNGAQIVGVASAANNTNANEQIFALPITDSAGGQVILWGVPSAVTYGDTVSRRTAQGTWGTPILDAANTVDNTNMADNAVDTAEIVDAAVTSAKIDTVISSLVWDSAGFTTDGTNCSDPAKVTINSGPAQNTVICTDNDGSTMYGHLVMPDSWNGGTVTFELEYLQTAADTNALNADVAMQCRGPGETVSNTWGTEVAIDDAAVTGSNAVDHTTSAAVTPAGTCAGGDSLWWRVQLDATGTTTAVATLHFLGAKIEYTSNVGD